MVKIKLEAHKKTFYDLTLKERVKFRELLFEAVKVLKLPREAQFTNIEFRDMSARKYYLLRHLTDAKYLYIHRQHDVLKNVRLLYCGKNHHELMIDDMGAADMMTLIELLNSFKFSDYPTEVLS